MARAADGSLRDALSLLEQARAYCGAKITRNAGARIARASCRRRCSTNWSPPSRIVPPSARWPWCTACLPKDKICSSFAARPSSHFRNLLVARVCGADSDLIAAPAEERPRLARAAAAFSEEDLTRFFQILLHTEDDLRRKPDPRLHLEMGLLRLVNAARLAPLEEVMAELSGNAPQKMRAPQPPAWDARSSLRGARGHGGWRRRGEACRSARGARLKKCRLSQSQFPRLRRSAAPNSSLDSNTGAASAAAPALEPGAAASSAATFTGLDAAQVAAIKAAIFSQAQFLGELVENAIRWELDAGEIRLYFPTERRALAELLQVARPYGEIAHHRQPRPGPAAACLC